MQPELAAQLKYAAEILETVVANRALLAQLSVEERTRLLKARRRGLLPGGG